MSYLIMTYNWQPLNFIYPQLLTDKLWQVVKFFLHFNIYFDICFVSPTLVPGNWYEGFRVVLMNHSTKVDLYVTYHVQLGCVK